MTKRAFKESSLIKLGVFDCLLPDSRYDFKAVMCSCNQISLISEAELPTRRREKMAEGTKRQDRTSPWIGVDGSVISEAHELAVGSAMLRALDIKGDLKVRKLLNGTVEWYAVCDRVFLEELEAIKYDWKVSPAENGVRVSCVVPSEED